MSEALCLTFQIYIMLTQLDLVNLLSMASGFSAVQMALIVLQGEVVQIGIDDLRRC